MNDFLSSVVGPAADSSSMLVMLLVFLAAGTLAFAFMAFARVRGSMKRRTARIMDDDDARNPKQIGRAHV